MRRLPSEPEYIRERRLIREQIERDKRYFVYVCVVLAVAAVSFAVLLLKTSPIIDNIKYKLNDIDCEIYNIDYKYGAGVYFECGDSNAMIDSGSEGHSDELLRFIKSQEIKKLDYLLISDVNTEYIKILGELLSFVEITKVIIPVCDESLYSIYDELLLANGKSLSSAKSIPYFPVNEMKFQITDTESMSCQVVFGNNSFLINNFIDENDELEIINSKPYLDSDVLILLNANLPCDNFLELVSPETVILNCKQNFDFNLSSVEKFSEYIYRTDINGNIIVKSDEVDIEIECEKQ